MLLHVFDSFEAAAVSAYQNDGKLPEDAVRYGWAFEPWMPCPATMWCGHQNDRVSASLVNQRLVERGVGLFTAGAGYVFAPSVTELWCAFKGDGGTMGESANHGCGDRAWCDPQASSNNGGNNHQCPWRPEHLGHMLAVHEAEPFGYNEVLVATTRWEAKLPMLIEAFFWIGDTGEAEARAIHHAFRKQFPLTGPRLVRMTLGAAEPFEDA